MAAKWHSILFGAKAGDEDMGDPADVDLFGFADEFAEVDPGVLQQEKVEEGHVEPDPVPELTPAEAIASVEGRSQVAQKICEVMEQATLRRPWRLPHAPQAQRHCSFPQNDARLGEVGLQQRGIL